VCPVGESNERLLDDAKERLQRPEVVQVADRVHFATRMAQAAAVRDALSLEPRELEA